jgi:hypothetical protein
MGLVELGDHRFLKTYSNLPYDEAQSRLTGQCRAVWECGPQTVGMQVNPLGNGEDSLVTAGQSGGQGEQERTGIPSAPRFAGVRDHSEYVQQRGILRLVHRFPPKAFAVIFGMIPDETDFDVALYRAFLIDAKGHYHDNSIRQPVANIILYPKHINENEEGIFICLTMYLMEHASRST